MAINLNTSPYYDDYDEEKAFYQILFKPGLAVQARELTQIQSILQNQVSKFGDHIFKNGAMVIPGTVNVDNEVHFMKLDPLFNTVDVKTYLSQFSDKLVRGETSGVTAVIVDHSQCDCVVDDTVPTLYYKLESTGTDGITKRFIPGETITAYAADNSTDTNYRLTVNQIGDLSVSIQNSEGVSTTYTNNETTDVLGKAFSVEAKEGIYYVNGRFLVTPELHLYVGRFSNNPSARVGFKVVEQIISSTDDSTLLDPAQGSYNYAAPGADRLKVDVSLVDLSLSQNAPEGITFVELVRVDNGVVQNKITKSEYSELEKTFARRTFDESGSYEVNKFKLSTREHLDTGDNFGMYPIDPQDQTTIAGKIYGDDTKFVVAVEPGKAYVEGYEVESIATQFIDINKAREDSLGNENGHVYREDEYPIATPVGTYVLVDNVANGFFNVSNNGFELVDLVGEYQYDTAYVGTSAANGLKIGTARVKFVSLHSPDYTGNPQFKLGLFDVKMNSGYTFDKNVQGIRRRNLPDLTTLGANIVPSTSVGFRTGSASISGTTVTGSGTLFVEEFRVGDTVVIDEQVVGKVTVITDQQTMTVTNPLSVTASGRIQVFRAQMQDQEYQDLMFKTGANYVRTLKGWDGAADTELNMDLIVQRVETRNTDGTGVFQYALAANENFLSDQTLSNFLLYKGNINSSSATLVTIDSGDISFTDGNRTTLLISNLDPSTTYTLTYSVRLSGGTGANARTKTLVEDYSHTVTGQKNCAALSVALAHADIFRIKDIRVTPGNYDTYNEGSSISVLNNYNLDNGQRPTHYQQGAIVLKSGVAIPATGALKIVYDYFDSTAGTGNYFSVDSYASIPYEDIPYATMSNGDLIRLSDVIDFRPIVNGLNNTNTALPVIGTDFSTSISHYLGRKDKLYLTSTGKFSVATGIPSIDPKAPVDPKSGLVLAEIIVPPYTLNMGDVKVKQRDNRRYTMHDIGEIDRRLAKVENYIKLSELEKQAANLKLVDANGFENFKNGFITDPFSGHEIGDVAHPDYRVSIDKVNKIMRPMHCTNALRVIEDIASAGARTWYRNGDFLTGPQDGEIAVIDNPYASRSLDVNPYKIGAYIGKVQLFPETDNWKDVNRRPDLVVTDNNNTEAIAFLADFVGTQWDEWQTEWSGITSTETTQQFTLTDINGNQLFQGAQSQQQAVAARVYGSGVFREQEVTTTITSESGTSTRAGEAITGSNVTTNSQNYGDRIVDFSYIPYMRSRPVVVAADNLKPETKFWPFFDSIDVLNYFKPADVFTVSGADIDFDPVALNPFVIENVPERAYNGILEPAYSFGDIIKNAPAVTTSISAITSVNATSFTVEVSSATSIGAGHHVILFDLAAMSTVTDPLGESATINSTAAITVPGATARQLNLRKFKVTDVTGTTLTLEEIDGSAVGAFDTYSSGSYAVGSGQLIRLQASGIVCKEGRINATSGSVVTNRDIFVVNVKNGFSVGETLTGTLGSPVNSVTLESLNGASGELNTIGNPAWTDLNGSVVGTFFIPNNDQLAFRTGERKFRLIDNRSNSEADFDSKGEATYHSIGFNIQKEATVVNSRAIQFVTDRVYESQDVRRVNSTSQRIRSQQYTRHDPLAQTFTPREDQFISSVDLYFEEAGNRPMVIEMRTTDNGVPGSKIIPGSVVTKQPSEINTSIDSSVATKFVFPSPVYVKAGETYALVVKTDEPGARIFASELGKTDILTQNVISINPLTGSLYLSQNTIEWEINPLLDLKIQLNKAQFVVGDHTIKLKVEHPHMMTLDRDPFEVAVQDAPSDPYDGWVLVRVRAKNHGLKEGNLVNIQNVAPGVYAGDGTNGIPHTAFNTQHTVYNPVNDNLDLWGLDTHHFVIKIDPSFLIGDTTDLVRGNYGGDDVQIARQLDMDLFNYNCNDIIPEGTSIKYEVNARNAARVATGFLPFVPNSNYFWPARKLVMNKANEDNLDGLDSLEFELTLTVTDKNISPVVDLGMTSVFVTSNIVNNGALNPPWVDEFDLRVLFNQDTLTLANAITVASGQITTSTASTTVNGDANTKFDTELKVGYDLYRESDNTFIGTVASITDFQTLELEANAGVTIAVAEDYKITTKSQVRFYNDGVYGVISTSIDTADNLLELTSPGNPLEVAGVGTGINGEYKVREVIVVPDDEYVGNADEEKVLIYLNSKFASDVEHKVDGINNKVNRLLSQVVTTSTASATVNGAVGSLFTSEVSPGDVLVTEDGLAIGTVSTVDSDVVLTLSGNAALTLTDATVGIQSDLTTYQISEIYGFADDIAPYNAYNYANYVSKSLKLTLPADSFVLKFQANIPSNTSVDIYYRTSGASETLGERIWLDTGFDDTVKNPENSFYEKTLDIKDIDPFQKIAIKICLKSLDPVSVPKIRNLQLIAYS